MDPIEKDISVTFDNDEVKRRKRKAETTVDNIHVSDKQIDSLCRPAVEGENAPQISPTIKKAKKSLRKQTNTSPVLDIDMDVNNSSREQKHTSCSPKAANNLQNNSKYPTTVKKAMKPLKKQTKTTLPLNNEGDACGELKQKQNGQSPCSKAVNRGSQVDSTDGQTYLTTRKKRAVGSPRASDQDDKTAFNGLSTTKQGKEKVVKRNTVQEKNAGYPNESQQSNKGCLIGETKEDEYVYRVLRDDESYTDGLYPKDIYSQVSLIDHVEHGSRKGHKSKFISCCKTKNGVKRMAGYINSTKPVVRINVTKLDSKNVTVIDLTDRRIRHQNLKASQRACNYAEMYEEVILQPVNHIPAECVEKIGIVKDFKFMEFYYKYVGCFKLPCYREYK
nr:uncharacterized protein LOC105317842 isoform X3 [Crassostrea gigas]